MSRADAIEQITQDLERELVSNNVDALGGLIREIAAVKYEQKQLGMLVEVYQRALSQRDVLLPRLEADGVDMSFPADKISIDALHPLGASEGFYEVEYDGQGRPYRWTGPRTQFQIAIFIPNSQAYDAKLTLFGSLQNENLTNLKVYVNGTEQTGNRDLGKDFTFTFKVPNRSSVGTVTLDFMIPTTVNPNSIKPEMDDTRQLGVAFHSLELTASGKR